MSGETSFTIAPRGPGQWLVQERGGGIVAILPSEAAALACRHELQAQADRLAAQAPPVPTRPAAPRKRHAGRWVDGPVVGLIAALAVSWGPPAAAQHSRVFECLQRARGGLSAETMLDGCRAEVREWLADCEQTRDASVCEQAVAEEAGLAVQQRRRP
jgi:hypothetical protein